MKKIIALFLAALMIFLLVSCVKDSVEDETDNVSTTVSDGVNTETVTELVTKVITNDEGETEIVTEVIEVEVETSEIETTKKPVVTTEDKTTNKAPQTSNNPADWSMEEVVEFYKKACANSSHVTSKQTMVMRKDSLKADGALGRFLNFAEGIIRGVMKLNDIDVEVSESQMIGNIIVLPDVWACCGTLDGIESEVPRLYAQTRRRRRRTGVASAP